MLCDNASTPTKVPSTNASVSLATVDSFCLASVVSRSMTVSFSVCVSSRVMAAIGIRLSARIMATSLMRMLKIGLSSDFMVSFPFLVLEKI